MRVLNASLVAGNMEPLMIYDHRKGLTLQNQEPIQTALEPFRYAGSWQGFPNATIRDPPQP